MYVNYISVDLIKKFWTQWSTVYQESTYITWCNTIALSHTSAEEMSSDLPQIMQPREME